MPAIQWPEEHLWRDSFWECAGSVCMGWSDLLVAVFLSVCWFAFASVLALSHPLCTVSGSWSFLPMDVAEIWLRSLPMFPLVLSWWLRSLCRVVVNNFGSLHKRRTTTRVRYQPGTDDRLCNGSGMNRLYLSLWVNGITSCSSASSSNPYGPYEPHRMDPVCLTHGRSQEYTHNIIHTVFIFLHLHMDEEDMNGLCVCACVYVCVCLCVCGVPL